MDLLQIAEERFRQGYSCSQSVFSVLADQWNIDPNVSLRVTAGMGGGVARSAGTCGCVTAGVMALGLAQRRVDPEENRNEREKTYEAARRFMCAFEARNGSTLCPDLLGCNISTPEGLADARHRDLFHARCPKLIRDAVELVQEILGAAGTGRSGWGSAA